MKSDRKSIFISGKMRGNINYKQNFQAAEWQLKNNGYDVVINPSKIDFDDNLTWGDCLKVCIQSMLDCNDVYVLSDWKGSFGASGS